MSFLRFRPTFLFVAICWLVSMGVAQETATLRVPVHPRRNVDEFPDVETKTVRFFVDQTTGPSACIDEFEIYGPDEPERNLALAANGGRARASGTLNTYRIHALDFINDGIYGNPHSWICDTVQGWVEIELPAPTRVNRVIWSRDREGKFTDRLATAYHIEVARREGGWQQVASSADRAPLTEGPTINPGLRGAIGRFTPSVSDPPGSSSPMASEYLVNNWQTIQGLPSNTVTAIHQTRDDWLWIGTTNGLARFDGMRFTAFGEDQGLPGLNISCLLEDRSGVLWVGTENGGLARWDGHRFQTVSVGSKPSDRTVLALAENPAGKLWIGTSGGLFESREGKYVRCVDGPVVRLEPAIGGGVWYVAGSKLMLWNGSSVAVPNSEQEPSRFTSIGTLASTSKGNLWFGGANGYVARYADGKAELFGEKQAALASTLWDIFPAQNGDVWIGTAASGLARLRNGKLVSMTTEDGLPSNSISAIGEDREGQLWVGTAGGGLVRLRPRRVGVLSTRDGLSHNVVMALAEAADHSVWIGTDGGGVNHWQNGQVEPFAPSYVLENEIVSSLVPGGANEIWVGTLGNGIFHVTDGQIQRGPEKDGLPGRRITALCRDRIGGFWIGGQEAGVSYLDQGKISRPPGVAELANLPITAILEDHTGAIWFGTDGHGIARLSHGQLRRWTHDEGLVSNFCRALHEGADGTIWIGTSGGLACCRGDRIENFTVHDGLPEATISQILSDTKGNLWLGTNRGILRVAISSLDSVVHHRGTTLDVLILNRTDGLPSLECTGGYSPAGLRTHDGHLYFGTMAGLTMIDPEDFTAPAKSPPIVLESWTMDGQEQPIERALRIFPAETGAVTFHFTALAFAAPSRVRFRYRLEGWDREWIQSGAQRVATYAHLSPGDFTFRVQASQDGSPWGEAPLQASLRILPAWWQRPWVIVLGMLAGLLAVVLIVRGILRRRFQQRLRAVEQQYALERERSRIARDIHDDLGANLTQIALRSAAGREQRNQPAAVEEQFSAIAATAEHLVQSMDAIVWAVNPRHDTLESLARYLSRFAEEFFAHSPVRLRLDVPLELPDRPLTSEARHNLFLACKEALNNALRHAAATEVRLQMQAEADRFSVRIEDNGRGFSATVKADGDGLVNLRKRLADCGGHCEISSEPGNGTVVLLSIPLPLIA